MDLRAIRDFINEHPEGVMIRMVDGTQYPVPHRDYVWFTPSGIEGDPRAGRLTTSFYLEHEGVGRLVNAMLVAEVTLLPANGHGKPRRGRGKKKT